VVINSMVNVDDLAKALPFGRIMSDQIVSSLHQAVSGDGYGTFHRNFY
jgi:hypothetical protein